MGIFESFANLFGLALFIAVVYMLLVGATACKRRAFRILLLALIICTAVTNVNAAPVPEHCITKAEQAAKVMEYRQVAENSMMDMFLVLDELVAKGELTDEQGSNLKDMVAEAYEEILYYGNKQQRRSVAEFSDKYFRECLEDAKELRVGG